jgi:GntR family transcriptional regulator
LLLEEIGRASGESGRLGSERDLAERTGLSRWTIRRALEDLEERGLVRRVVGRNGGTFVGPASVLHSSGDVSGLPNELTRQGFVAGVRLVSASTVIADPVTARNLGVDADEFVYSVTRIRLADGTPLSLEHAHFPTKLFPDLFDHPLSGSIYDLLRSNYGVSAVRVDETMEASPASADQAEFLAISVGAPVLIVRRTSFTDDNVPFEYSCDIFRGDRTRIIVSSPAKNAVQVKNRGERLARR